MSKSQPKFRASKRLDNGDYLTFAIWPGKSVPEDEIMNVQLRTLAEGQWKTTSKLTIYRRKDGTYSQLSDSVPVSQPS
jgi:hypothetical protein